MRYIVFGDTGGHFQQLYRGLLKAGMTEELYLPENTIIIHCGDLVHKGPQSKEILEMIEKIRIINPGQWIQIMGNHEAQYLGGVYFRKIGLLNEFSQSILERWYNDGFLKFTYAIPAGAIIKTSNKEYVLEDPLVFSHAGISFPFWEKFLRNYEVEEYNNVISSLSLEDIHKPGLMMGIECDISSPTGTIWSHGIHESWFLWNKINSTTFNQAVGHIFPYLFHNFQEFFPGTDVEFQNVAEIHENELVTIAPFNDKKNSWMLFMDPGYENEAHNEVQPFVEIVTE